MLQITHTAFLSYVCHIHPSKAHWSHGGWTLETLLEAVYVPWYQARWQGNPKSCFGGTKGKVSKPVCFWIACNTFVLQFTYFCRHCITNFYGPADKIEPWSVEGMHHCVENLIIEHDLVSWLDYLSWTYIDPLTYRIFQSLIQSCFTISCHSRPSQASMALCVTKIRICITV